MEVIKYEKQYDKQLEALDKLAFLTVKYHPDLIEESIRFVVEDGELLGFAYLLKRGSFLAIERLDLESYELILQYGVELAYENPLAVLQALMNAMKEDCDRISALYPDKKHIQIKTWILENEHDLIEEFLSLGFVVGRSTIYMVKDLSDCKKVDISKSQFMEIERDGEKDLLEIKEIDFDEKNKESYRIANEDAFYAGDSIGDIEFKLQDEDVKVFAAMKDDEVIASVMIWKNNDKQAATENIFCKKEYQRLGITSAVIDYVCGHLKKVGYKEAALTVYQDNPPAFSLYEKMGYRYCKFYLGIVYEKDYEVIAY